MNRIYQGRVSKVEIPRIGDWSLIIGDSATPPVISNSAQPPHHELFQDAVISFSASDGEKVAVAG